MAITPSGAVTQDLVNGVHKVGYDQDVNPNTLNSGSLTVDGNSIANLTATNLAAQRAQRMDIGNEAGTNGLVTITGGSGATIHFDNAGLNDTATGLIIGNHGGDGRLELTGGGVFEIKDLSTTAVDVVNDYDDQEYVVIGRDANSRGELSANASTFHVAGNSVFMEIGRNDGDGGGVGEVTFANGSTFQLKAGGAGADSETFLQIGRGAGASGVMSFDNSTGTLDAAVDSYGSFLVGAYGGSGLLELDNTSHFTVNGGAYGANASIGRGAGAVGKVTIANNADLTFQGGSYRNGLTIGRDGGTGTVELTAGADASR